MKKSTIAVSMLAALAVIATGGAWLTGKQIEDKYQRFITQANAGLLLLKAHDVEAHINVSRFERGVFSSEVQYTLDGQIKGQKFSLQGNDKIYHGPLPLNRLTQGKLLPVMAGTDNRLEPATEETHALFNHQTALTAQLAIGYAGEVSGKALLNPMKSADGRIETSAIKFEGSFTEPGQHRFEADFIRLEDEHNLGIVSERVKSDSHLAMLREYPNIGSTGSFNSHVNAFKLKGQEATFIFNDVKTQGNNVLKNDRIASDFSLTAQLEVLSADGVKNDFGQFTADITMNLDAAAWNELLPYLSDSALSRSPEKLPAIQKVLEKAPDIQIKTLSLAGDKGKNELNLALTLLPFDFNATNKLNEVLGVFKQSALDIKLNLASSEQILAQFIALNPLMKSTAAQQAKQEIAHLAQRMKMSGLAQVDAENIKLKLEIDNGKVKLNGSEVPERQLQMVFFAIMLGSGGH